MAQEGWAERVPEVRARARETSATLRVVDTATGGITRGPVQLELPGMMLQEHLSDEITACQKALDKAEVKVADLKVRLARLFRMREWVADVKGEVAQQRSLEP